jgi:hypothetical protein
MSTTRPLLASRVKLLAGLSQGDLKDLDDLTQDVFAGDQRWRDLDDRFLPVVQASPQRAESQCRVSYLPLETLLKRSDGETSVAPIAPAQGCLEALAAGDLIELPLLRRVAAVQDR